MVLIGLMLAHGAAMAAGPAQAQPDRSTATPSSRHHDAANLRSLGLTLAPGWASPSGGVAILEVDTSSDAAKKGIKAGDVILGVGDTSVYTREDVAAAVKHVEDLGRRAVLLQLKWLSPGEHLPLLWADEHRFVAVRLQAAEPGEVPRGKKDPARELKELTQATKRSRGELTQGENRPESKNMPIRLARTATQSPFELSIDGPQTARKCNVRLIPAAQLGKAPPVLTFATEGPSNFDQLTVGLENAGTLKQIVLVQNNRRTPFQPTTFGSSAGAKKAPAYFSSSDLGRAIVSAKPFHITGTLSDGSYVSSRYEQIDLKDILEKLADSCLFDIESYIASDEPQRIEDRLALSMNERKIVRWVLNKKFTGRDSEPAWSTAVLTDHERGFLKRFYVQKGFRPSGFLTRRIVDIIKRDGVAMNIPPPPPPPPSPPPPPPETDYFTFRLCNESRHVIAAAISARSRPGEDFRTAGWYIVGRGKCTELGPYAKGWFYFYGEKKDSGGRVFWGGIQSSDDINLCIVYPGPFDRVHNKARKCKKNQLKGFRGVFIDQDVFTWTMY